MNREDLRHYSRYVVNAFALIAAVLTLPEFGQFVPPVWLPMVGMVTAILNTVISWLRTSG